MKKFLGYLNIIFFVLISYTACACENVKALASKAIERFATDHTIQAVYAVADKGKIVLHGAQGFADFVNNKRLNIQEQMPIASGTKTMTAAAILLLQDKERLDVQDTVAKYLTAESGIWQGGKVPAWAHEITIHNLLTHSGGLPEYVYTFKIDLTKSQDEVNKDILHFVADKKLEFTPGTKFVYNNTGYMILGMIVEQITGQRFADFMKHEIFKPNGMTNTRIASFNEAIESQLDKKHIFPTRYYIILNGEKTPKFVPVGTEIVVAPNADGGAVSTVADLIKWNKVLHEGKLLSKKSYKQMTKQYYKSVPSGGYETHIGYGLYISKMHDGTLIYHHEGKALGIRSDNGFLPKKKISYAIISNAMLHLSKEMVNKFDLRNPENQVDIIYLRNIILESL